MQSSASELCPAGSESDSLSAIDSSCLPEKPLWTEKLDNQSDRDNSPPSFLSLCPAGSECSESVLLQMASQLLRIIT